MQHHCSSVGPLTNLEIDDLITIWTRRLVLFARQWVNSADDVVQDVFVKLSRLQSKPDDVVGWLFMMTRSTAINHWKAESIRTRHEKAAAQENHEWFLPQNEDRLDAEFVKAQLLELPLEFREVVIARLWGGLSFVQVGILTGVSRKIAKQRYDEAIELLRKHLKIEQIDGQK